MSIKVISFVIAIMVTVTVAPCQATLIAEYNFDGGSLANSAGVLYSPLSVVGAAPDLSANSYHSDGIAANYLERAPSLGSGQDPFTVSVWVWTETADQGGFKGIFSNGDDATEFRWQMDSHNGSYRLAAAIGAGQVVTNFGPATANVWQNLVLVKDGTGTIYLDGVEVGTLGNPGGLFDFRIGINRNSDSSFLGLIDNVQIWDTAEDAAAIFAAGPGLNPFLVPEHSTLALSAFGLLSLGFVGWRRRRR